MTTSRNGITIWERVIDPEDSSLSPEAARSILQLDFRKEDQRRMRQLAAKARKGTLTPSEKELLEEYLRVADVLALWQSKARRSLRQAGMTP